jgi:hypothetical protein
VYGAIRKIKNNNWRGYNNRLEGLGHIIRMEGTHIPKMIPNTKSHGRHGIQRPKSRWLDDVEVDIKAPCIQRWKLKAQDRKEWTEILREDKAKLKVPYREREKKKQ